MFQPNRTILALAICLLPALARAGTSPQELAGQVKTILKTNCYRCHGENGANDGKMAYVIDLAKLVERQKVVPGNPARSKLYKKIASEDDPMPPLTDDDNKTVTQRPSKAEIALVRQWIEAGAPVDAPAVAAAPRTFISDADILAAIAKDLDSVENDDDHPGKFFRYFTITHLYNAGLSDDELQTYRGGLSKLINSLSWGRQVKVPFPLANTHNTVFRIDLRHYKWNEATWKRVLSAYPYGITFSTPAAASVYRRTECELPYVRADWFVFAASRPPLYHDVLDLPGTDVELERRLEVDVAEDIRTKSVARAGFNGSGVSRGNRMIERHESQHGAYWKSYDVAPSGKSDRKNFFARPLGPGADDRFFEQDGGEIIFNLPNGLQAYMLVNARGQRIDEGPIKIVSTKLSDPVVVNGVSCMYCHARGMIEKDDQVRATVLGNAGYDAQTRSLVSALYPPKEKFEALLKEDAERFTAAVEKTGAARTRSEPIVTLSLRFQEDLDAPLAAAEAGLTPQKFRDIVSQSPVLAPRLGALNIPGGTVQRDVFVAEFGDLVREIAFGTLLRSSHTDAAAFTNSIGMKLVRITPGTFMMGSPAGEEGRSNDETQHQVTLTKPYYMGAFHVTRGQFAAFVADTGDQTDAEKKGDASTWRNPGFAQEDSHPVVEVSWNDAVAYTEWLSRKEHKTYRLPTEAEWEYACRAGTTTPFNTGATISTDQANYDGNSTYGAGVKGVYRQKTTAVGTFSPNKWGLYDMHGNAWQWCSDVYGDYPAGPVTDPTGPAQDPNSPRVLRGGSWDGLAVDCRSAYRSWIAPGARNGDLGFRVVLDSP